jgi:hypothetical protein
MSIGKIIGIFVCVVLLFSCNKNNKGQDSKFENENETVVAKASDDDFEDDINSPYSDFFYVWEYTDEYVTQDQTFGYDYTYIVKNYMTITSKLIKFNNYWENTYDDDHSDFNGSKTTKYNIENTVWEPITIQEVINKYGKNFNPSDIEIFPTGYKITGTFKFIEGGQYINYQMTFVFLNKDDPSIMLTFTEKSSAFDYHRIDRKKN